MYHTPLHVSAGNGNVDIVKYLLDWPGSDKVELEAMNTVSLFLFFPEVLIFVLIYFTSCAAASLSIKYGETPLHMAAKNGCNEAAKLLLERGAFIEAKASVISSPSLH